MAKITKLQKQFAEKVDSEKLYAFADAVKLLKDLPNTKFDESVEVVFNLGVNPKHADQMVRSSVVLPHGTGKTVRVAVIAKGEAADAAKKAGADVVGAEDLVEKIIGGFMDFDRIVATPDCMQVLSKAARILGPKGLMPNPKLGTVTPNAAEAVEKAKAGQVDFRAEKNGIVHTVAGKKSFDLKKIEENIAALVKAVKDVKPTGIKGIYMQRMTISTTMGPGIKVDIASL